MTFEQYMLERFKEGKYSYEESLKLYKKYIGENGHNYIIKQIYQNFKG